MPKLEAGRVIQFGRLSRDGIDDFLATVSGVDAPQARRAVQYPMAVRGGVIHAFVLGQQTWVLFELTVCREGHPQFGKVGRVGWAERKSTRLNSSHLCSACLPSFA